MHITLRQLRVFEAVVRHRTMSRAAAELHLTQPAVSMQMKQLEEQIGVPLFEPLGRRRVLTDAGQALHQHAAEISGRMEALYEAMEQFRGLERGLLRLAVVSTVNHFLPRLLGRFHQHYPGVRIGLQVGNRDEVMAALADHGADLAITGRPPDSADVVAQHFMDNPLVVIAAPEHPLAARREIPLAEVAAQSFVVRESGSGTRAAVERHFAAHGQALHTRCEVGSNEALKQAVRAGLGLGVVPAQALDLELMTGCLAVLQVQGFPIVRRWYLVQRAGKRPSAAASAFCEMLLAPAQVPAPCGTAASSEAHAGTTRRTRAAARA